MTATLPTRTRREPLLRPEGDPDTLVLTEADVTYTLEACARMAYTHGGRVLMTQSLLRDRAQLFDGLEPVLHFTREAICRYRIQPSSTLLLQTELTLVATPVAIADPEDGTPLYPPFDWQVVADGRPAGPLGPFRLLDTVPIWSSRNSPAHNERQRDAVLANARALIDREFPA